jgi:SAM-dependent methyltransferase
MMTVCYDHRQNLHSLQGAEVALSTILSRNIPGSLLDIGCGTGTWLRAATDLGVGHVLGIDGAEVAQEHLHVAKTKIKCVNLSEPFNLGRRFDLALCLEVAEHLPERSANNLISSIICHSDSILFGAACPGQPGQNHVNCQWPIYWQRLFNSHGFVCDDSVRWQIWDDSRIPPWYRQNSFWARRDPDKAGREPRLKAVIHPDFRDLIGMHRGIEEGRMGIEEGRMPISWYFTTPPRAAVAKLIRAIYER